MKTQQNVVETQAVAGTVGNTEPSADSLKRSPPAEVSDEGKVRLGDGVIYFDPSWDQ
jgi:hypothetical protein